MANSRDREEASVQARWMALTGSGVQTGIDPCEDFGFTARKMGTVRGF